MTDTPDVQAPKIEFPCERYPIKVIGDSFDGFSDLVIEIISPGTAARDQIEKLALYERHGVREYWIFHPSDEVVIIRVLEESGRYGVPRVVKMAGIQPIATLNGLALDLDLLLV